MNFLKAVLIFSFELWIIAALDGFAITFVWNAMANSNPHLGHAHSATIIGFVALTLVGKNYIKTFVFPSSAKKEDCDVIKWIEISGTNVLNHSVWAIALFVVGCFILVISS